MFMLAVLNSFILYQSTAAKRMSHFVFRRELLKQLLQKAPFPLIPAAKLPDVGESVLFRLDTFQKQSSRKQHLSEQIPGEIALFAQSLVNANTHAISALAVMLAFTSNPVSKSFTPGKITKDR
ncbi:hypothetical protein PoB_004668400 [Plakobranchus ocellatus]|uniref:Uncharacterized protein n=1 Tax=Plakobranchus ocellatus TaxID=259542 RepID=A0AAV4BJ87_9GAST|nr:hypothetical protein PoB_004668400 [Plakobranchus ocellatus]